MRASRDSLADAAAEQPVDKARLTRSDNDQIGVVIIGGSDDGLRRLTDDANEFGREVETGEKRLHTLAMLLQERLIDPAELVVILQVVRHQAEGSAIRHWYGRRRDTDDDHLRVECSRELAGACQRVLGGRGPVVAGEDRLHAGQRAVPLRLHVSQTRVRRSRPHEGQRRAWRRRASKLFCSPDSTISSPAPVVATEITASCGDTLSMGSIYPKSPAENGPGVRITEPGRFRA